MKRTPRTVFRLLLIALLFGCRVTLIGSYDQTTDQCLQKIQDKTMTLLVGIDKNIKENQAANSYDSLKPTFIALEGELKSIDIRCKSLTKYGKIEGQVQLLMDNLQNLEKFSKLGFDKRTIKDIDSIMSVQFAAIAALQNGLKSNK